MRNTIYHIVFIFIIICFSSSIYANQKKSQKSYIQYVDPFIGTSRDGNQLPGSRCPFGMIQPNPLNVGEIHPEATNYKFGEPNIFGIALTNMVGVGCGNYGSIVLKPTVGNLDLSNFRTPYSQEKAEVGYYSVFLDRDSVKTEITTTNRTAILKFHFPKGKANLYFDLSRRQLPDTSFMIKIINPNEIVGYKTDGTFCSAGNDFLHRVYFAAKINNKSDSYGTTTNKQINAGSQIANGEDIGAFFSYVFNEKTEVEVRVAVSYLSIENARENLEKETDGKTFDQIKTECQQNWNNLLSRIDVEGGSENQKAMFYTALYHTMSHPHILDDYNGQYPAMGSHDVKNVEKGKHRFTIFSLWDTYRTLHPFFTLVYPDIQEQMAQSLMGMYYEHGWLPQWELISKETYVMVGDPATIALTDTYLKGIHFDSGDNILKACLNNAENYYDDSQWGYNDVKHIRRSIVPYLENNGWIPYDAKFKYGNRHWASVATTQEYNLADWNISELAKKLGQQELAKKYLERSKGYKNLYNPETGFLQQRWANGNWVEPFNPFAGRWPPKSSEEEVYDMPWPYSGGHGYCEGMAWHYNFFVPHDINGLINLMGGQTNFINRLQTLFDNKYYEATNEPDLAFPFLFNYVKGEEWRTTKTVTELINNEYGVGTDGIPGNDDTGTMSSWLLFAMMGMYPDCPGSSDYQLFAPVFDKVTIHLDKRYYKSDQFSIVKNGNSSNNNKSIKKIILNGKQHTNFTINHTDIVNGKKIEYNF